MVSERERVKKTENRLSMVSSIELEAQSQTRDAIVQKISLPYHISNYKSTTKKILKTLQILAILKNKIIVV